VAVLYRDELLALRGFGRQTYDPTAPAVTAETIFDLASVSKVVATTTMAAVLSERGKLDLDGRVPGREDLTIRGLLTHTSGLPAYIKLFEKTRDRDELLKLAYATPLEVAAGSRTEYSDIGFILLGDVLEKAAGERIDQFCAREIFQPLELRDTLFTPPSELSFKIAPTRDDRYFRNKLIQGEVNDENAWVMKGVAGHAGVFSTAYDVAMFAECWLTGGAPILTPGTVAEFTQQQAGSTRALGWDRPTPPSSSGKYFSASSFGHLGYTGTSLWCDPEKQLAIVLLTNRTWPDASNQAIKQVRPAFHDAIIEAL
jgi:CubicO group peptidase (beta-lactamase class C family)